MHLQKRELNVGAPNPAQNKEINSGGYECEPIGKPTKELQTICSICLLVLREPQLISCCGYHFCQSCINPIKEGGKSCPLCVAASFEVMYDKGLERSLKEIEVNCSRTDCQWTGRLHMLNEHLGQDCPKDGKQGFIEQGVKWRTSTPGYC